MSKFSLNSNSQLLSPQWDCQPILSSQGLNCPDLQFDYYSHHPYVLPQHCYSQHLLKVFLSEGKIKRCLGDKHCIENVSLGDVAIVPAGTVHHASWQDKIEFILLSIKPNLTTDIAQTLPDSHPSRSIYDCAAGPPQANRAPKIIPRFAVNDPLIYGVSWAIKTHIESDCSTAQPSGRHFCYSYVRTLFGTIFTHLLKRYAEPAVHISNSDVNTITKQRLQLALEYIEQNLSEKLTLDEIAQKINLNKYYLCRLFVKHLNISPRQYIIKQRVAKAEQLLKQEPSMQIVDIALVCGFASHSHFNRQFNKNIGMSPKAYRNNNYVQNEG